MYYMKHNCPGSYDGSPIFVGFGMETLAEMLLFNLWQYNLYAPFCLGLLHQIICITCTEYAPSYLG